MGAGNTKLDLYEQAEQAERDEKLKEKEMEFVRRGFYGVVPELYSGTEKYSTIEFHRHNKVSDPDDLKSYIETSIKNKN